MKSLICDIDKSKHRYRAQRGDLVRIPSPFWGNLNRTGGSFRGLPEAMRFDRSQRKRSMHSRGEDRRLPMALIRAADESLFGGNHSCHLVHAHDESDGWDHIQYLGEYMVRVHAFL